MSLDEALRPPVALRQTWCELGYWREISIAEAIEDAARRQPRCRLRVVAGNQSLELNLETLVTRGRKVASGLSALGLVPGDVIAIQMPNWAETWIAYTGAIIAGLVILPIVPAHGPSDLRFAFGECKPKAILTPTLWRGVDQVARLSSITKDMVKLTVGPNKPVEAIDWTELEALESDRPFRPCNCDDVAFLIYTSGTTGTPKGVLHSHRTLLAELAVSNEAGKPGPRRILAVWPPGHVAGLLTYLRFVVEALETVLLEHWDAKVAAQLIQEERITSSGGTGFHLSALLDAADADGLDISSLVDYRAGGAAIAPDLVDRCEAKGIAAFRSYGLSEHPTIAFCDPFDPLRIRARTDGRVSPGSEVRIQDVGGRELPRGQLGEIVSRGPETFVGYFRHELDAEALQPGGWLKTGDLGWLDEQGLITVTGRLKELIIRGGENISPGEIEALACRHPHVLEAAAVGAPDDRLGERIGLFVITSGGIDLSVSDFELLFRSLGVARQKTPEIVITVDEFPRTAAGKVQKHILRQRFLKA